MEILRPFEKNEKSIKINTMIEDEILKAFQEKDISILAKYLSEKGIYFGSDKRVFLANMQHMFNTYKKYSCKYLFGISNQLTTCNKIHEFTYTNPYAMNDMETFDDSFIPNIISLDDFNLNKKLKNNQYRIQFVIIFEDHEIVKIYKPNNHIDFFDYTRLRKEN
jgi:hypothetical protein